MSRKAAVLGSPINHSRSPQLHLAAYRALGLDWTYERILCNAHELPSLVGSLGPEWVGLSVTMPGKFVALEVADERTPRAELLGSANTLVHTPTGWRADNTDVDGVTGALRGVEVEHAAVLGSGGTAPAAIAGLTALGVQDISIVARNREKVAPLLELGERCGVTTGWVELGTPLHDVDVVVNTIPADVAARYADSVTAAPVLLDAIYDPWPTPLAESFAAAGGRVISGLQMLLNQAYAQVEQFTGRPAPKEAMIAALAAT
ncbi:shikimate 5-dehydrogenase [Mycobacterium antarcticum]|uniref:shikimate dehydrogenase n=1 Tax=unclassified Mycolicibacterium TaxID=2636767 RepID=UPI002397EBCF|nr:MULTISPECIES: shikimate dehydrogenase [unclassified Mycolicibacterium]BDX32692.1 shikimate 5-dehydrogenase [Mycolicibacterium sp. TUM20985]GLP75900.1 shikimate 5-dehydrogenase [Mycolicibacterium sp. TUM20983]GLP83756.1 shikimate 5-dehydrogenase [Mycolicibacterium sp. TUM20984]